MQVAFLGADSSIDHQHTYGHGIVAVNPGDTFALVNESGVIIILGSEFNTPVGSLAFHKTADFVSGAAQTNP